MATSEKHKQRSGYSHRQVIPYSMFAQRALIKKQKRITEKSQTLLENLKSMISKEE
jgi:hypothetical protein